MRVTNQEQKMREAPLKIAKHISISRILEMLLNLSIFIMAVFLASYINSHDYGSIGALPVVAIMSGLAGLFSLFATWCSKHFNGYERGGCIVTFMVLDCLCIGLQIPLLIVLSVSGAPWNCHGLPETGGVRDRYCAIPTAAFWESIVMLILYLWTFSLGIRLMVALSRRRKLEREMESSVRYTSAPEATGPSLGTPSHTMPLIPSPVLRPVDDARDDTDLEATVSNGSFGRRDDPPPYPVDKK